MPCHQAEIPNAIARERKKTKIISTKEHHHPSLDMNVNAIHVRDIRVLDQTLWRLQSLTIEFEMNNPLSVEFEASSRCIDHLHKSCTL